TRPLRGPVCGGRGSDPWPPRTVLRGSLKRERRGERLAKSGPPFWYPRPPPLTLIRPLGSTTRIGLVCTLLGWRGIVSVIWYTTQEPFFWATARYWWVRMPAPLFSLIRLKRNDHPRISLMRHFSHPTMTALCLYASAISCRVGSFCGSSAKDWLALIAATNTETNTADTSCFMPHTTE